MQPKPLDPLTLPLDKICLIEASAGTGKTYTIANLYLRLLLGVGCPKPLTVEQILVVTFTVAATQELKDRIRQKIHDLALAFQQKQAGEKTDIFEKDPFLNALYEAVKADFDNALLRLKIAEQDIDLASIFTIHSFCQKMLMQFAFDSGVRFDMALQTEQSDLLKRLSEEVWRELFYPMNLAETQVVAETLGSPSAALGEVRAFLTKELPALDAEQQWVAQDFSAYVQRFSAFMQQAKQHWRDHAAEIAEVIRAELNKDYKKGEKKSLNRRSYQKKRVKDWINLVEQWSQSEAKSLPDNFERFCQDFIAQSREEGGEPLAHAHFAKNQQIFTAYQNEFSKPSALLSYQFLIALREKLQAYKQSHKERSFDDILTELNQALKAPQGKALASHIRAQFPFAMIDEFQDTDREQYEIFSQIFMENRLENQGFVMIGDPKQSIYKFRGADIFTYIQAAKGTQEQATLAKNWRSVPCLVENTNKLFHFKNAFLYEGIEFQPVSWRDDLCEELSAQSNFHCYLQTEFNQELAAKQCAYQIQQQLKLSEAGAFYLQKNGEKQPLVAENFAVLVRTKAQAKLMKKALSDCHIQSVVLSEDRSVYDTEEAKELLFLLRACLSPYDQRAILAALGSNLWRLTASQLFEIKQNEARWDEYVSQFEHYQRIWQQQGILPMLHQLLLQQKMIEKMKSAEEADRRITNLLHLAELLQSAMPSLENETALLHWYENQLQNPSEREADQTLRLESEEKLVKIVTIHGSKGLQYPIVWLPFVGGMKSGVTRKTLAIYRDEQQQAKWSFGAQSDDIKALLNREEEAEDLRLLYVAITRAEYQLNLILPAQFDLGKNGDNKNAMLYLLTNGEMATSPLCTTEAYLKNKGLNCEVAMLEESVPEDSWQPASQPLPEPKAAVFTGKIQSRGLVTSFSALSAQHERNTRAEQIVQDYDYLPSIELPEESEEVEQKTAYSFPRSMEVGTALHSFFEHCDFSQPIVDERVKTLCEQVKLGEEWVAPTKQWLEQIINTPFGTTPFALNEVSAQHRLNELGFYMRLSNPRALPKLNQLIKRHSPLAKDLPDLQLRELEGFVNGFIDCVIRVNGQFYILDYKSNYLGSKPQDYTAQNIAYAMGQHRYDLQYLLYTLAVHRYLTQRLGNQYDYERDFGGVAYLFLRGMSGTENSGVYFDKPTKSLVEEMDKLFG